MKHLYLMMLIVFAPFISNGQHTVIEEGVGVGPLKIGQTYEEVEEILGFAGKLRTYKEYLADELFNESPKIALECALGFDYYVKYEHLLTLPVSFVFFKDDVVSQIMVSSFPAYYFPIAKDAQTKNGLNFWESDKKILDIYGEPELKVVYDGLILDAYFYFKNGITINLREDDYRSAHIYSKPDERIVENFSKAF